MLKTAVGFLTSRSIGTTFRQNFSNFCKMSKQAKLEAVASVEIDEGVFKYVLIKIYGETEDGTEISKNIVRGFKDCQWHSDIYERVSSSCQALGLDSECLGGGRIEHNPDNKLLKVYGYSQGYGKADHSESKKILEKYFNGYEIEISDEGY